MEREHTVAEQDNPVANIRERARAAALDRLDELTVELDDIESELTALLEKQDNSTNLSVS